MGALMVLVTLRNLCISIEVGDGDGISPALTRASDDLSLSFWSSMASLRTLNNLLRFGLFHLRLLRSQRTRYKAKVFRISCDLCVREEVGPRKGI
jgi:hypothetical protein